MSRLLDYCALRVFVLLAIVVKRFALVLSSSAFVGTQVDKMDLVGSVEDSDVIIVDDMIDTAGTLCKAASVLKACGGKLR